MSTPVDSGRLAEARDAVMKNWMAQRPANVMDLKPLLDVATGYLEAPSADWCETHDAAVHKPTTTEERRCDVWVIAGLDGWRTTEPCAIVGPVRLVPEA